MSEATAATGIHSPPRSAAWRRLLEIAVMAGAYWAAGRLALLLAIPPGYATAAWPAAGLALAGVLVLGYRVWPGIVLGSFLVNFWISLETTTAITFFRSVAIPLGIGAGASLQAVFGGFLVRRFIGYPNPLAEALDILKFMLLGGPVSCLVNATCGVTALLISGVIPWSDYPFSWSTWWVGDTIGTLIFAPLILLWTGGSRVSRTRSKILVTAPLCLSFGLVVALFIQVSSWEAERLNRDFERRTEQVAVALERMLSGYVETLHDITRLYASTPEVDRAAFGRFVQGALSRHAGIQALWWVPRVPAARRAAYEQQARRDGHLGFQFTELDAQGRLVRAAERAEYYPLYYGEPPQGNERALGLDVGTRSGPSFAALLRARDTGRPAASGRFALVQETQTPTAFVVYVPIFGSGPPGARENGRDNIRGYAQGAFRIADTVQGALKGLDIAGTAIRIYDEEGQGAERLLYEDQPEDSRGKAATALSRTSSVEVGGRRWTIEFSLTRAQLIAQRTWAPWTFLAAGLGFTGVLGALLLVVTGGTTRVEDLVTQRTGELAAKVDELQRMDQMLSQQAAELARSNADLERFASAASHDLREPLRMVTSFLQLLERRYKDRLDATASEFIGFAVDGAKRMDQLISDLLAYSRVGAQVGTFAPVSAGAALDAAVGNLKLAVAESAAHVTRGALPDVRGDATQLGMLFQNLLENAIKFRTGTTPRIHVWAERQGQQWVFAVRDNGIGLPPEHAERIFAIFQRLHTREEYPGTGVGLAICKRIVERHGGRIWVESDVGRGATFFFALPAGDHDG